MLRLFPKCTLSFAPVEGIELDALLGRIHWRGRATLHSLSPSLQDDDPLPDPYPDRDPEPPQPEREPHLLTPTDVPVPEPTDVPVPEPWDVPPPDPSDPRPKSIP